MYSINNKVLSLNYLIINEIGAEKGLAQRSSKAVFRVKVKNNVLENSRT